MRKRRITLLFGESGDYTLSMSDQWNLYRQVRFADPEELLEALRDLCVTYRDTSIETIGSSIDDRFC
jgi:hypothetical protein